MRQQFMSYLMSSTPSLTKHNHNLKHKYMLSILFVMKKVLSLCYIKCYVLQIGHIMTAIPASHYCPGTVCDQGQEECCLKTVNQCSNLVSRRGGRYIF